MSRERTHFEVSETERRRRDGAVARRRQPGGDLGRGGGHRCERCPLSPEAAGAAAAADCDVGVRPEDGVFGKGPAERGELSDCYKIMRQKASGFFMLFTIIIFSPPWNRWLDFSLNVNQKQADDG